MIQKKQEVVTVLFVFYLLKSRTKSNLCKKYSVPENCCDFLAYVQIFCF
jgi:hypothetical protein